MLRVKRRFIKGFVSIVVSLLIVFFVSYPYFGLEEDKKFLLICSFVVFIQGVFYFLSAFLVHKQNKGLDSIVDLKKVHRVNKMVSIVDKITVFFECCLIMFGCLLMELEINLFITISLVVMYSLFFCYKGNK